MLGWLTPDSSELTGGQRERSIVLPGNLFFYVTGALALLSSEANWEQFGDATIEETAEFFQDVLDDFLMSDFRNVGMIAAFSFSPPPDRWLAMGGQTVAQSDYPELAAVVPSVWKSGSDMTLPDMEDTFLAHVGDTATLGQMAGANTHTLTLSQIPSHTHTYARRPTTLAAAAGAGAFPPHIEQSATTGPAGGGAAHNNMPKNMGVIYAIYAGR